MKTTMEKRQEVEQLFKTVTSIEETAKKESRELSEEENHRIDVIQEKLSVLEDAIKREERTASLKAKFDGLKDAPIKPEPEANTRGTRIEVNDSRTFPTAGHFFSAVVAASTRNYVDPRLEVRAPSGMNEGNNSEGGFLVPPEYSTELLKRTYEVGEIASRVNRRQIQGNMITLPYVDETSRAEGSRYGGVRVYSAAEAATVTAAKPKFGEMTLKLNKLMGLCYLTDELMDDANALNGFVADWFVQEMAFKLDGYILTGTGAGEPLGIMSSAANITQTKGSGQSADTITYENITNMWSRMWAPSRKNAVWVINQDVEPQLYGMTVSGTTTPVYLPAGGASAAPYASLLGRPIIVSEHAKTLGDEGDIMLLDLSEYLLVDKGSVDTAESIHVRFIYDEMTLRFTYRVDGQPKWHSALTPLNGTKTLSPFISLQARS